MDNPQFRIRDHVETAALLHQVPQPGARQWGTHGGEGIFPTRAGRTRFSIRVATQGEGPLPRLQWGTVLLS